MALIPLALALSSLAHLEPSRPGSFAPADPGGSRPVACLRSQHPGAPPSFVRNQGQFATDALFVAQFPGLLMRVERAALLLQVYEDGDPCHGVLVRMDFEGADSTHDVLGEEPQDTVLSYFRGNDPSRWQRDVGTYAAVRMRGLYEGIDLVVRSEDRTPKYDLLLAPGADLSRVVVRVQGADGVRIRSDGALSLATSLGDLVQPQGRGWQADLTGAIRWFACEHRAIDAARFGFVTPDIDPNRAFVVDPSLVWSTYLGSSSNPTGPGDWGWCVDVADNGDVVTSGNYSWVDFPTTPGSYHNAGGGSWDIFVTKLRGLDGGLVYSAVLGGSYNEERPKAVTLDSAGRATVAGWTTSEDFPTTPGAFDRINNEYPSAGLLDAFVLRLNPAGSDLEYSTYLGTTSGERAYALAVTASGSAIVGGTTGGGAGGAFPTTAGAYQASPTNLSSEALGFITRLDPSGSFLEWSTVFGSSATVRALALDSQGRVVIAGNAGPVDTVPVTPGAVSLVPPGLYTGPNAFIARLSSHGGSLHWCGILGGSGPDDVTGLALDAFDNAFVCGYTQSANFPTTPNAYQTQLGMPFPNRAAFVSRFNSVGSALDYSTYFGGAGDDQAYGIAVDASGVATFAGRTGNLLTATPGAFDTVSAGGDMFIARLFPDGKRRIYTTFLGGPATEDCYGMAMTSTGRVAVTGMSTGFGYPTTPGVPGPSFNGGQNDAVISVLDLHPLGVSSFGSSTPSCLGPLQAQASAMPAGGMTAFSLLCSAAPPNSQGWLLVSSAPLATSLIHAGGGLWVDPRHLRWRRQVTSDAQGFIEQALPPTLLVTGQQHFAQFLFESNCMGLAGWTASNALDITVQ